MHVVTVNDYLAQRDAGWMGQVYHVLGLDYSSYYCRRIIHICMTQNIQ